MQGLTALLKMMASSARDLAPIIIVVGFFQLVVLQQPLPDVWGLAGGVLLVLLGLTLFMQGLELALFPLGESMAGAFANKGSLFWLLTFAFALGFGTTAAEPSLTAVAAEAARIAAEGNVVDNTEAARAEYAMLRSPSGLPCWLALSVSSRVGRYNI